MCELHYIVLYNTYPSIYPSIHLSIYLSISSTYNYVYAVYIITTHRLEYIQIL